jgi:hypothetical protein
MDEESEDYARRSAEFKRWLALYFIEKGYYKTTDKAIEEFGTDNTPKQTMEFAEVCSDREREERTQYRVGLTKKEKKKIAHVKIADMIDKGKSEELYDEGHIVGGRASWKDRNVRIIVVRKLAEILDKNPRNLMREDFYKNRLRGLFATHYNSSPYVAISEAFHEMDIKPWEMTMTPIRFYENKGNRVAAVRWLIKKVGKDPRNVTYEDFCKNGLRGLLDYCNKHPYAGIAEAFPELDIKPWEMIRTPHGFFDEKENRIVAVKWLVQKLGKDPRNVTYEDFYKNRLSGLFDEHYNSSPYVAISEAFHEMDIKPWEMTMTPRGFYENKENRVAAVKWLIEKLKKDPRDLTMEDFYSNGLAGLLTDYYGGSPYEAVREAFPEVKPWEMIVTPRELFDDKKNRIDAVKWLVEKLKKDPRDLTKKDFNGNRLTGLFHYYNDSPYEAVKEADLVTETDEKYMRRHGGARFKDTPSSKEAREAAKKLARNAEKKSPKGKGRERRLT